MYRIVQPKSVVHSLQGHRIDASGNNAEGASRPVPDPRPESVTAGLLVDADPASRHLGRPATGAARYHQTGPAEPLVETLSWPADRLPLAGRADLSHRVVLPLVNHGHRGEAGIDRGGAFASVSRRALQEITDDLPATNQYDGQDDGARQHSDENTESAKPPAPPSGGWLASVGHSLVALWRRLQQRRDVSRSIAELSQMDDRTLRDIGIYHRLQIPDRVRFGRHG